MLLEPQISMHSGFDDPRRRSGFLPHYYPKANGKEAPPFDASARNDRIMHEFLAAYYDLNCLCARLLEIRARPDSPQRGNDERECLQAVEKALIVRDGLEDRYAPLGVIAEPVVKEGFTEDVKFGFGNRDSRGRPRADLYTITAQVPIPLPRGAKIENFIESIEGPEPFIPP
ncbi:MAG: hypothetical protein HY735_12100 [Verrucomicrobia bacterium]|nr:hypothetical protein [Verrucomicrobiota bacterium]